MRSREEPSQRAEKNRTAVRSGEEGRWREVCCWNRSSRRRGRTAGGAVIQEHSAATFPGRKNAGSRLPSLEARPSGHSTGHSAVLNEGGSGASKRLPLGSLFGVYSSESLIGSFG